MLEFEIIGFASSMLQRLAVEEIEKCNAFTADYGLILTHNDVIELVETRSDSLKSNGRIEFGGGAVGKIIKEFCDSPYIYKENYAETIHGLTEIFYFYKNETLDLLSDDDLIKYMKDCFDGSCQGSLELLAEKELAKMATNLRYGYPMDYTEEQEEASDDEWDDSQW